LLFVIEIFLFH